MSRPESTIRSAGLVGVLFLFAIPASAQVHAPARPAPEYKNGASFGLSYGNQNDRDADFWGWSLDYSRQLGGRWYTGIGITWDRESEDVKDGVGTSVDTFTLVATVSYALTRRFSVTAGLGKGFADTDNLSRSMTWTNGDLGAGIAFAWSTPGLKRFERDSIAFSAAYEYNITQQETSLSIDVAFGWSF